MCELYKINRKNYKILFFIKDKIIIFATDNDFIKIRELH